jgi:probable HAF family extracellular repeat protein
METNDLMKRVLLASFAAIALTACAAAQTYTITDIGVLKGDNESNGFFINSSGAVVGCADTANSEGYPCTGTGAGQHAFYWTKSGGLKDLGILPGGNISGAIGLNDSGEVVGYSNTSSNPLLMYNFIAFEWTSTGGMVNLGKLSGGNSSCAFEINSSGVIAGDSFVSSTIVDATSWTNNKIKNLGALSKSIFTAALAINDDGDIVGESVFGYGPPFTSHGFEWTSASGMKDLGTLSGGNTSIANAINSTDIVAGQSNSGSSLYWHAVKWDASNKIEDLGTLPGGTYSIAFGINDSSEIVGYGNISNNAAHALLWTSTGGMQDLNNLIPANSGWVLINANAINASGQITGYGTKGGHNHAFLLTPSK